MKKPRAYIFDIDGTLADSEMRHLFKDNIARGDWSWFVDRIPGFPTIPSTVKVLKALKRNYRIIFLTVRSDRDRVATQTWLEAHGLYDGELYMRPDQSKMKDYQEKERMLLEVMERYTVIGAVDDNAECLRMFRRYGIPTFHFNKG